VRKGNPKHIRDWDDLAKPGVAAIIPNPKTSGNGKYSYLAAWGYAQKKYGSDDKAREFVGKLFRNVPVLDAGGRGATTTFVQRGIGDALLTFENEVQLIRKELGGGDFEVIYPSVSILVEAPVAVVDKYADKHGTRATAQAYLEHLYSDEGQELAAKHYYRPRNEKILARYAAGRFPNIALFSVDEVFGSWAQAQKTHFDEGGTFDRIYANK
jgi:sulfate transport system substrate-binding protein